MAEYKITHKMFLESLISSARGQQKGSALGRKGILTEATPLSYHGAHPDDPDIDPEGEYWHGAPPRRGIGRGFQPVDTSVPADDLDYTSSGEEGHLGGFSSEDMRGSLNKPARLSNIRDFRRERAAQRGPIRGVNFGGQDRAADLRAQIASLQAELDRLEGGGAAGIA